jgi:hypothetical protein
VAPAPNPVPRTSTGTPCAVWNAHAVAPATVGEQAGAPLPRRTVIDAGGARTSSAPARVVAFPSGFVTVRL